MVPVGLEKFNHTVLFPSKCLDMLGGTFFVVCLVFNGLFLLFFAVELVVESPYVSCCIFTSKDYHWYFPFRFLTTVDLFYCLFWSFWKINKYTVPSLFLEEVQKINCYLSVSSLTSKNIKIYLSCTCLTFKTSIVLLFLLPNLWTCYAAPSLLFASF